MTRPRDHVDEVLISGYVDDELTQADAQRVRVHLEECASCRETANELTRLKEVTMGSRFQVPSDTQWDETPRTAASRLARNAAIVTGLAWLLAVVIFVVIELADTAVDGDLAALLLVGGFVLAAALLILSALLDRREASKHDRYRRVQK